MSARDDTRSPIKDRPLRHAGQSLEEERRSLIADKLETWLVLALVFVTLAAFEWWRDFFRIPPKPVIFTAAALIAVAFAAYRIARLLPKLRRLSQGIDGEKAVGQFLERLRQDGYHVFHDIAAPGFNVDHVLIGRAGIFAIETKTWSKPARGDARISFDGERLLVGNQQPERDPVLQAKAQAAWLKDLLTESTGRRLTVLPVLLFPGWFINASTESRRQLWVLEPKALPAFLEQEPQRLDAADVHLAAYHLSRIIRRGEAARQRKSLLTSQS